MKKLLVVMMVVVMTASLAACTGAQKEAYDLYLDMNKAMDKVTSVEMGVDSSISMEVDGQTIDVAMKGNAKEIIRSDSAIDMEMIMDTTMVGQSFTSTSYYKEGYLYQEVAGQKFKSAMNLEQAAAMANAMESMQFEKDAVLSSEVTEVDGGKQLSFTLDGAKVTEIMDNMIGSTLSSMGIEDVSMEVGDMSYIVVLGKDNMPKSVGVSFVMTMDVDGQSVTMDYQVKETMTSFNSLTEISYPTDLDSYQEAP